MAKFARSVHFAHGTTGTIARTSQPLALLGVSGLEQNFFRTGEAMSS